MKPFIHAVLAGAYIVLVVFVMDAFSAFPPAPHPLLVPIAVLGLFVLSAAVMGFLFLYHPVSLLIEGDRRGALVFFGKTVGVFAALVVVYFTALLILLR